jgi:predicted dehydrogenase
MKSPVNREGAAGDPRPLGIGVIGHGFMGKVHSNAYLKIPYSFSPPAATPRLRLICGRNGAGVADAAARLGFAGSCTDWRELVEDPEVDVVDVCTPDSEHAAPSIAALAAGKHVICEKPLAMTVEEARSMARAARGARTLAMLCHNYRFIPAIRLARQLIESATVGKIYHFRITYLQEPGHDPAAPLEDCWYASGTRSGVLRGIGCHAIDLARHLVGEVVSVSALARTWNTPRTSRAGKAETVNADEGAAALVEFAGGAYGTIECSGVATGRKNEMAWELNGSRGSLAFNLEDPNHLRVYSDEAARAVRGFANVSVTDPGHPLQTVYLPPGHNAGWEYGHVHALHHLLACIAGGAQSVAPLAASFEDGERIQLIMQAIMDSSASGRRVALPS